MPSLKPHLNGLILDYESQLERDFLTLLDHDPNCIDLQPQPVEIPYITKSGKEAIAYPDCWAYFKGAKHYLFEIKSESMYQKMVQEENWKLKSKAIEDYCRERGWTYQILTELKINCVRLNNLKDLITSAKHYSPSEIDIEIGSFYSDLNKILKEPTKFYALLKALQHYSPLKIESIISLLKYNIYHHNLYIDWNKPLEKTIVSQKQITPLTPIYKLEEHSNSLNYEEELRNSSENDKDTKIYRENKEFKKKLDLIKPIINKFGKDAKRGDIINYCIETKNKTFHSIYRYYRRYKRDGKEGLYSQRSKKHSKSHLDPNVEKLLQKWLYEYNHGKWSQAKPVWEKFKDECKEKGLEHASYKTFTNRINSLPATERIGKFKPPTQSNIPRGLVGTYREGKHPGCVIQMDHTPLDIWLVDPLTREPIGRPHLTLGIDTYSRSIWSYFLSFNKPSRETVLHTIISGLIYKEGLPDWNAFKRDMIKNGINTRLYKLPSSGFPGIIQVDNGMDFQASEVKHFCMQNNITLEFRRVKRPDFGGFVESIWDTINDAIRNAQLPGRVFPQQKEKRAISKPKFIRPPDYDEKEDARLNGGFTLETFREWLFSYFVLKHSANCKANQNYSLYKGTTDVQLSAIEYLVKINSPQAIPYLIETLLKKEWRNRNVENVENINELICWLDRDFNLSYAKALMKIKNNPQIDIPVLIKALNDENCQIRERAAFILNWIDNPQIIIPIFIKLMHHTDPKTREIAISYLIRKLKNKYIIVMKRIYEYYRQNSLQYENIELLNFFYKFGILDEFKVIESDNTYQIITPVLIEALDDDNREIREKAVITLNCIDDDGQFIPIFIKLMDHTDPMIRKQAQYYLIRHLKEKIDPKIISALDIVSILDISDSASYRKQIFNTLSNKSERIISGLRFREVNKEQRGNLFFNIKIIRYLIEWNDPQGVSYLIENLDTYIKSVLDFDLLFSKGEYIEKESNLGYKIAIEYLSEKNNPKIVTTLIKLLWKLRTFPEGYNLKQFEEKTYEAIKMCKNKSELIPFFIDDIGYGKNDAIFDKLWEELEELNNPVLIPSLIKKLNSESEDYCQWIVRRLTKFDDPRVIPSLIKIMDNEESDAHRHIINFLSEKGDNSFIPIFVKALDHPWYGVKFAAIHALHKFSNLSEDIKKKLEDSYKKASRDEEISIQRWR